MIYNSSAYESEKDEKTKAFLHFISTNDPGKDDFTNRLSRLVEKIKDNEKFRTDYAAMNLHDRDLTRAAKKAIEAATNLLKLNKLSIDEIAQAQGLSVEKVQELKSQLEAKK